MITLGIGGSAHDFSACIVRDGEVVVAIEEERLSRIKHHPLDRVPAPAFRLESVDYCLRAAALDLDDVDVVVGNDLLYAGALRGLPRVRRIGHHLAHAALAAYACPDPEASVVVLDGFGSVRDRVAEIASTFAPDEHGMLQLVEQDLGRMRLHDEGRAFSWGNYDFVEDSIGELFAAITRLAGFGQHDEGKTMGLAPLGTDALDAELLALVAPDERGAITFDAGRRAELERWAASATDGSLASHADVAHAGQAAVDAVVTRRVARAVALTQRSTVAAGGGVFLNSVANGLVIDRGTDLFVHGATADSGTAIGAALLADHEATGRRPARCDDIYLGRSYGDDEIEQALREHVGLLWTVETDIVGLVAAALADGAVVGWFQGRSEFGPRALGNRSIVADPSRAGMKDRINALVKHREAFRPFAPSILAEEQDRVLVSSIPSAYMCVNGRLRAEARSALDAAAHVDGSVRHQTVTEHGNPRYHALLRAFHARTGVPALLNTSFNDREPIVESPGDAIRCFVDSDIDLLALGDTLVRKRAGTLEPTRRGDHG